MRTVTFLIVLFLGYETAQAQTCSDGSCSVGSVVSGVVRKATAPLAVIRSHTAQRSVLHQSDCPQVPVSVVSEDECGNVLRSGDTVVSYRSRVDFQTLRSNRPVVTLFRGTRTKTRNFVSGIVRKSFSVLRFGSCR